MPSSSPQNMLPYMAKERFKWDSGARTCDGGRFSRWVPSDHMSLKAEDFLCQGSVREMWWKRGSVNVSLKSCWWLWSWRRGSWLKECGWPLARWNGPRWKPVMVQGPQPSSCKGMNSDHKLLEQEDWLSPGASGREHSSDATFSLIWRDPKTFLNC